MFGHMKICNYNRGPKFRGFHEVSQLCAVVCPQSAEMVKVVLTGGSGSIAAFCREDLSASWFPCARIECPLIYAFFIPFFRWGDWGMVIRKLWPWLELRQCGCRVCALWISRLGLPRPCHVNSPQTAASRSGTKGSARGLVTRQLPLCLWANC